MPKTKKVFFSPYRWDRDRPSLKKPDHISVVPRRIAPSKPRRAKSSSKTAAAPTPTQARGHSARTRSNIHELVSTWADNGIPRSQTDDRRRRRDGCDPFLVIRLFVFPLSEDTTEGTGALEETHTGTSTQPQSTPHVAKPKRRGKLTQKRPMSCAKPAEGTGAACDHVLPVRVRNS